jgi:tetratricopeptide (TPR) repeat protein
MSNEGNTREPADVAPEAVARAQQLVGDADELVAGVLAPGAWPEPDAVERFLGEGTLDRVLSLYGQAMRLDPREPSYPWNLASALNRLGINDLALGFMARAINLAAADGDEEWSGLDAQLALAEVAIDAGDYDLALTALAHAQAGDPGRKSGAQIKELLEAVRTEQRDPQPQASLASLLENLPA